MKIGKKSMPINRLILIIDDNRCQLIDWYRQSMTIDANRWQSIITHTWTIDCSSIININRLIGIDCHRMPSIPIDHRFHRLGTPWIKTVIKVDSTWVSTYHFKCKKAASTSNQEFKKNLNVLIITYTLFFVCLFVFLLAYQMPRFSPSKPTHPKAL